METKKKIIVAAVTVLVLAIVTPLAYFTIRSYASEKKLREDYERVSSNPTVFFEGSSLNGEDISGLTPDEVIDIFEGDFNSSSVSITSTRTGEVENYYYSSINADFNGFENYVTDSFAAQSITYEEFSGAATPSVKAYEYDINEDISFNNADFSSISFIDETKCDAPKDAYVYADIDTGETSIVPEEYGALADRKVLISKLLDAIKNGKSSIDIEEEDYLSPGIISTDEILTERQESYNSAFNKTLVVYVCGLSETLTSEDIRSLIKFDSTELVADKDALSAYVDDLKKKYDSYNGNYTFTNSFGNVITLDYGNYGWLIDKESTIDRLEKGIFSKELESTARCAYFHTCSRPTNALQGNSYLEISLEHQKVWLYIDGALIVHDDCTTGEISQGEINTYPGFFHVKDKKREVVLRGPTWEDFVNYWILYDEAHADGIHDATWREEWEFGGENRNGNGSHGCVNLRLNTAAIIYENLTEDMPVIIW